MTTVIYGHSDDTLVVDGKGIDQDFSVFYHKKGRLVCTDGTELAYYYDDFGLWRFDVIKAGSLFDHKLVGKVPNDQGDVVHMKDGAFSVAIIYDEEDEE